MGLLDTFLGDTPEKQQAMGLLGVGMMNGGFRQGGALALQSLLGADERAMKKRMIDMQMQEQQMRLAEMQRNQAMQQQMDTAARNSFITPEKANSLSMGPMPGGAEPPTVRPGFNANGYADELMGINPMEGLKFMQAMGKQEAPVTVAAGASLVDPRTGRPIFTAPKEHAPTDVAKLIGEMNALPQGHPFRKVYESAIQKATTHQPGTNVNLAVNTDKSYFGNVAEGLAKNDVATIDAGRSAPDRIASSRRVREVLATNPITGTGAEARLALNKALATAGVIDGKNVANTEVLASTLASQTLDAIKTSGLGAGQGFTDKDRAFLERAKSGNIEMTPQALSTLADLNERAATATIKRANTVIGKLRSSPQAGQTGQMLDLIPEPSAPAASSRSVVRQGTYGGRKVIQYSDGTVEYAN